MSDSNTYGRIRRPDAIPLPETRDEMIAQRKGERVKTLNDHVEDLHLSLFTSDPRYDRLLDAVYDEDTLEGSLAADNLEAARMLRDLATKNDRDPYVRDKKLATISKSLGVVLRRYGISRKERSVTVRGERVDNNNVE